LVRSTQQRPLLLAITPSEPNPDTTHQRPHHQAPAAAAAAGAPAGIVKSNPTNNFLQWLGRSNALLVFAARIPEVG
jgi:hypothetical protein